MILCDALSRKMTYAGRSKPAVGLWLRMSSGSAYMQNSKQAPEHAQKSCMLTEFDRILTA